MYVARSISKAYGDLASIYLEDLNTAAAFDANTKSHAFARMGVPQLDPAHGAMIMTSRTLRTLELTTAVGDLQGALTAASGMETWRQRWMAGAPNEVNAIGYAVDKETRLCQVYDSPFSPSMGDPVHALEHAHQADALLNLLLRDSSNAEAQSERAFQLRRYSYLHGLTDPETGVREGREAIAILERQQRENGGANDFFNDELGKLRILVATHLSRLGRGAEARSLIESALATHRDLAGKNQGALYYRISYLRAMVSAAACYRQLHDLPAALEWNRQATDLAAQLTPLRPNEVMLQWVVGNAYVEYGRYLRQSGDSAKAREWMEKDAAMWRDWKNPNSYVQLRQKQAEKNLSADRTQS
jgi:hypothetical protein